MMKKTQRLNTKPTFVGEIPNTPWRYFWFVSQPFKKWVFASVFLVVLASVLGQGSTYIFKLIVDAVEAGNAQPALWFALAYPLVIFIVQMLYRASGFTGMRWIAYTRKYGYDLLSNYLMKHSHGYFTNRFAGSLMSKISNVNNAVDELIPEFLWTHLNAIVTLMVTISFLVFIDIPATLVFITLILVLILFNRRLAPEKARLSKASAEAGTVLRGRLIDVITNIQAVRQYARRPEESVEMNRLSTDLCDKQIKNMTYTELMLFWNGVILFLFATVMFWFVITGWQAGRTTTGELVFVIALFSQITYLLVFIGRAFNATARTVGELDEGLEEVVTPYEIVDDSIAKPLRVSEGQITFNSVQFKFDNKSVFSDFTLSIEPGQRLGLVGQSGAGKTTFVSLLLRQHDVASGEILIDGQNIANVTQDSLREHIAVVPQEPLLFHRTIRENIAYGKPDATDAEIIEVAQKAQAHDFILELSDGYDTLVGERGVKLSGGQKQRVAIARAMLKDAPILVLDEATSALDSESEVAIQQALETLMEGRTVIAIAHRLSTLRKMDRIIVMQEGKIIEDGSHDSLAHAGGTYERLWNHQAGGFLQE